MTNVYPPLSPPALSSVQGWLSHIVLQDTGELDPEKMQNMLEIK